MFSGRWTQETLAYNELVEAGGQIQQPRWVKFGEW